MSEGRLAIEFERPVTQPVADHVLALIGEILEPFGASISGSDLPVEEDSASGG